MSEEAIALRAAKYDPMSEQKLLDKLLKGKRGGLVTLKNSFELDGKKLYIPGTLGHFKQWNMKTAKREDIREYLDKPGDFVPLTINAYQLFLGSSSVLEVGTDHDDATFNCAVDIATSLKTTMPDAFAGKSVYDLVTTVGKVRSSYVFGKFVTTPEFNMDGLPSEFTERKQKLFEEQQKTQLHKKAEAELTGAQKRTERLLASTKKEKNPHDFCIPPFCLPPPFHPAVAVLRRRRKTPNSLQTRRRRPRA